MTVRPCRLGPSGHDATLTAVGMPDGSGLDVCGRHVGTAVTTLLRDGAEFVTVTPIPKP